MTPVIVTNCSQPTELRLSDEAIYTWYLNPIFLLLLFATNALNIRLRVFKPVSALCASCPLQLMWWSISYLPPSPLDLK